MNLILGIYDNSFARLKAKFDCEEYDDFFAIEHKETNCPDRPLIRQINTLAHKADNIYFDLSNIRFKLTEEQFNGLKLGSATLRELHLIITTPEYLNKTQFYKDGQPFNKEEVLNWFLFDPIWDKYAH